jgi:hypothetical protein
MDLHMLNYSKQNKSYTLYISHSHHIINSYSLHRHFSNMSELHLLNLTYIHRYMIHKNLQDKHHSSIQNNLKDRTFDHSSIYILYDSNYSNQMQSYYSFKSKILHMILLISWFHILEHNICLSRNNPCIHNILDLNKFNMFECLLLNYAGRIYLADIWNNFFIQHKSNNIGLNS